MKLPDFTDDVEREKRGNKISAVPSRGVSKGLPSFTIGVEEEYQIIDPKTRELTSYAKEFLNHGLFSFALKDQIKPELMQSQIEVGSKVCSDVKKLRKELVRLRQTIRGIAAENKLQFAAASTHPFSNWEKQQITVSDRYKKHKQHMAELSERTLIFGMHVHIGIEDKDLMIDVMNQARYFLPHLLALSTSSPFWRGRETGMMSYRSIVFENMPRTGPPPAFLSYEGYERFVETLVKTHSIEDASRIWWDIRPHHKFPTLEFRIFDICPRIDDAVCLASLTLAIVAKLIVMKERGESWKRIRHHLVTENKWRAVRYGINGKLLDFNKQEEVPVKQLVGELLAWVDEVLDPLGVRDEVEHVHAILKEGTSADRQLTVYDETKDFKDVVDLIVSETTDGLD